MNPEYFLRDGFRYQKTEKDFVLVGTHTLEERNEFVNKKALEYMQRHPEVGIHYAKRQARIKWARQVRAEAKSLL